MSARSERSEPRSRERKAGTVTPPQDLDERFRAAVAARGQARWFMDYHNSDGSLSEMCGNGIRCLALYAGSTGLTSHRELKIETRAGIKVVEILDDERVRVDMGPPIFAPADIPVELIRRGCDPTIAAEILL